MQMGRAKMSGLTYTSGLKAALGHIFGSFDVKCFYFEKGKREEENPMMWL